MTDPFRFRRRRTLLAAVPALLLATGTRTALAAPGEDAESFVRTLGERTQGALTQDADPAQRFTAVSGLLEQAADLDLIARLVLGRHWRAASEAQRRDYLALFHTYARDGLARRFSDYGSGGRFAVIGSHSANGGDTLVSTTITLPGGRPPVHVDWRVRHKGDRLVVIDVVAEGVSMLITNRAQFDALVVSHGMDGLLAQMRRWHDATPVPGAA